MNDIREEYSVYEEIGPDNGKEEVEETSYREFVPSESERAYLQEISRYPLLSADEERTLARLALMVTKFPEKR